MKIKMIGGSRDGQTIDIAEHVHYVNVAVPKEQVWWEDTPLDHDVSFRTEVYVKSLIRGATEIFTVLTPSGWSGDDLIRTLIGRA